MLRRIAQTSVLHSRWYSATTIFPTKTKDEWLASLQKRNDYGVLSHLGFKMVDINEQGGVTAKIEVKNHHMAPNGFLHAACVVFLADTVCGFGCYTQLPSYKHHFTTVELKSNHVGTAKEGDIIFSESKPLHMGRSTHVWEATVYRFDEKGERKNLAFFRATQIILDPKISVPKNRVPLD